MRVPQIHSIKTKYSESQCGGQVANSGSTIKTGGVDVDNLVTCVVDGQWMGGGREVYGNARYIHPRTCL